MGPLKPALARALEARRDRYNAAFAQARHMRPRLDADAFARHLTGTVAPIVEAVDAAAVDDVTEALYDISLEMLGTDLLSQPAMARVWTDLLPALPRALARSPRRVVAALCNAVHQMSAIDGVDVDRFIVGMRALALDGDALFDAGKALAWRCGMAHYREGGMDALRRLPDAVAGGIVEGWSPTLAAAMAADRWLDPSGCDSGLRIVARLGAFRGFGGLFLRPPTVRALDGQLVVTDGVEHWMVTADVFGATFHRCVPRGVPSRGAFALDGDGTVSWRDERRAMALLRGASSFASTDDTLAVTLPRSHHVYLVARSVR